MSKRKTLRPTDVPEWLIAEFAEDLGIDTDVALDLLVFIFHPRFHGIEDEDDEEQTAAP